MDIRIKNIVSKPFSGFKSLNNLRGNQDNIVPINHHEVIFIIGLRLVVFDYAESSKSKLISLGPQKRISEIRHLTISSDSKYLAVSVSLHGISDAVMMIITVDAELCSPYRKPKEIFYNKANSFECIAFSQDNSLITACSEVANDGILIFDRIRCVLTKTIKIPSGHNLTQVSFCPDDIPRVCGTGTAGLFNFWRFNSKTVHSLPISGLPKGHMEYTCHVWMADNKLIAGTKTGQLVIVQACETQNTTLAFGSASSHNYHDEGSVDLIRVSGNHVIAASQHCRVSLFEVQRAIANTTLANSNALCLVLKAKFIISNFSELRSFVLSSSGDDSYLEGDDIGLLSLDKHILRVIAASDTSICNFEINTDPDSDIGHNSGTSDSKDPIKSLQALTIESPTVSFASLPNSNHNPPSRNMSQNVGATRSNTSKQSHDTEPEWSYLVGRQLCNYHINRIDSLSMAVRSSTFITLR